MNIALGAFLAILAGCMNGLFALPMKANREWAWENNWLAFSVLSLGFFPWLVAWTSIPHLLRVLTHISSTDVMSALCWGFVCYSGSLLFGLSIDMLGIGVAFALLIGTMTVVGVLGPYTTHWSLLRSAGGFLVLGGVLLSVMSVALGSLAARRRPTGEVGNKTSKPGFLLGILFAVLGGALSGLLPIAMGLPWSLRIESVAQVYGLSTGPSSSNMVLAFILLGGAIPNCTYCIFLLAKKGTFHRYLECSRMENWTGVLLMGILYSASIALWGVSISSRLLGPLGPSVGWALFVGTIVLSSTAASLVSGEWTGASRKSLRSLRMSVSFLIAAMVLICLGNYLNLNMLGTVR